MAKRKIRQGLAGHSTRLIRLAEQGSLALGKEFEREERVSSPLLSAEEIPSASKPELSDDVEALGTAIIERFNRRLAVSEEIKLGRLLGKEKEHNSQ
jgi:hypothetical protein